MTKIYCDVTPTRLKFFIMSAISRTTVGGCTYDALCKGAINYACDRSCLVDLAFNAQRQCPIQMLAEKLEENLQGLEIERDGKVTKFYIGKAYVMQKKKRGGGFQRFDAMDPNTWRQNGISSRWRRHKQKGRHGLIVLTVVTRFATPDDLSQQVYATTLQQKLIEYYKKDPRFEDENYRGDGRRQIRQMFYGYALYVAFIIDENHDMTGSDDGCAGVPFNIINYESPTRYCISNSAAQNVSSRYVNSEENGKKIDAQKCSNPQKRVRFQDGLCSEGHNNELLHRTYASPHGCTSTNFNHRFMVFQMSCPSQSNTPSNTINLYSTPDASRENTKVKRISLAANPKTLKSLQNNSTLPPPHKIPHVSSSVEELVPFNIAPSLPPPPPLLPPRPCPPLSPPCPHPLPPPPTSSLLPSRPRPLPTPLPPTSSLPPHPRPLPTLPPSTSSLPPRPRPCPLFFPPPPPHRRPPPTPPPFLPSRPHSHPLLSPPRPPRPCPPLTSSLPPLPPSLPPPPTLLPSRPCPLPLLPHHHRPPPPTPPPTPPTPSPPAMFTDATSFSAATAVRMSQFVPPANRPRHISVIVSLGKQKTFHNA